MMSPTPRDAVLGDVQRLQAIEEALAGIDGLGELPIDDALVRLDAAHQVLTKTLSPGPGRQGKPKSGTSW